MMYELEIIDEAKEEIRLAYFRYEDQVKNLGERFLLRLNETFDLLLDFPYSYPEKIKNYRECYMGNFPFLIVYKIVGNKIQVRAVFHISRNPKMKRR